MQTKRDRRAAATGLYSAVDGGSVPRDITFDNEGVVALVGQQGTNEVWFAERVAAEDDETVFRVLLVVPSKSKGFQMSRRTGRPEFGERLTACQYFVGDVTVPAFGRRASLGNVLRAIQEQFRRVQRDGGVDNGNLRGDRDLGRVYDKWFADLG